MTASPLIAIPSISIPLSGEWCISIDKDQIGEASGWTDPAFDDSTWKTVHVPHTWNVMPDYSEFEGFAWYRRSFLIPQRRRRPICV